LGLPFIITFCVSASSQSLYWLR